jgi:hypothetical protein
LTPRIGSGLLYETEIEISNGNGVNRMARRVGHYLVGKGFNVADLSNAPHFGYPKTEIYYRRGYLYDAYRVAREIPGYQDLEEVEDLDNGEIKIRVLIGKNLVPFNHMFKQTRRDS